MEGRILRLQADANAQPRGAGFVVAKSAIRRMLRRAAAISAAAVLLGVLTLVASSIAKVGVAPAKAYSCTWADKGPRHISRKHARHAVLCAINKQRRKHGRRSLDTKCCRHHDRARFRCTRNEGLSSARFRAHV